MIRCDMYCCSSFPNEKVEPWVRLSPNGKLAFYKVPKCMSTSIEQFWGQEAHEQTWPHDPRVQQAEDSFTVVRNPYSRVESLYRYRFGSPNFRMAFSENNIDPYMPFEEFIWFMMLHRNHHWEQATRFVPGDIGHVFKMEDLEPFYRFLNTVPTAMPRLNQSPKEPVVWTRKARELVQNEYRCDFERFGYEQ